MITLYYILRLMWLNSKRKLISALIMEYSHVSPHHDPYVADRLMAWKKNNSKVIKDILMDRVEVE